MSGLLPCPFCGTSERDDEQEKGMDRWLQVTARSGMFMVECYGCGVEHRLFDEPEEAIEAWNTRTPTPGVLTIKEERELAERRELEAGLPPLEEDR